MNTLHYDFVVLGSGIAGLTFALHAAKAGKVAVVCKASLSETNTSHAQGGIAAVMSSIDSFEQHVQDTLEAGAGLCDEEAVRQMAEQAPQSINWLQEQGVPFDSTLSGQLALGLEGGHRQHRIAHVKDHTGISIQQALGKEAINETNIHILEQHMGLELLVEEGQCFGVQVLDLTSDKIKIILAQAVVLATGGAGQIYQYTTNPAIATGDGLAMAHRAGAEINNMEFFQFHPTALYEPDAKDTFLISEALRGAGAELVLPDGSKFMHQYHPLASLAPRDIVARAVYHEMQQHKSPCLFLDARHLPDGKVRNKFPFIYAKCKSRGIQVEQDLIPIVPAAHYQCGGVQTDLQGQTSITGLYAVGEVACTGVHGANRLASNSLLEGVVFGKNAAEHAIAQMRRRAQNIPDIPYKTSLATPVKDCNVDVVNIKYRLQQLMWDKVGIVRMKYDLLQAQQQISSLQDELVSYTCMWSSQSISELRNLLTVAEVVVQACLTRTKSVGGHYLMEERACLV